LNRLAKKWLKKREQTAVAKTRKTSHCEVRKNGDPVDDLQMLTAAFKRGGG
jgi:hypothetical protein